MVVSESDKKIIQNSIQGNVYKLRSKKIVLFGCTPYVKEIVESLEKCGCKAKFILDNNEQKAGVGKKCFNVSTITPRDFFASGVDGTEKYIICSKYEKEMRAQLNSYSVLAKDIISIPVNETVPTFSDSEEVFNQAMKDVKLGWNIYQKLAENYGKDSLFFVCPYPGSGDIYMACSYLRQYIRKENIEKYSLAVVGNNCKSVAKLFGYEALVLKKTEMDLLLKAWEFLGNEDVYIKPLLHWGWRTKRFLSSDNYPQVTFNEMFLHDTFGLDSKCTRQLPRQNSENNMLRYFREYELLPGKTVLLAPYAGSFKFNIDEKEWIKLIAGLKTSGYTVCCNCVGSEQPLAGTIPVNIPYDEIINFLDYAGGFIGVRSGLCDIVSSTKAKMVVLYASGFNASSMEYFGLKKMKLNDNAYEYVIDEANENFVERALEIFCQRC